MNKLTEKELDLIFDDLMALDKKDLCEAIMTQMSEQGLHDYLEQIHDENKITEDN